jgi:hypothetical protein
MTEGGSNCNGQCHPIYRTDGHIKQREEDKSEGDESEEDKSEGDESEEDKSEGDESEENEKFLGSKYQFCAAFYHVHKWDDKEHFCLVEDKCIITQDAKERIKKFEDHVTTFSGKAEKFGKDISCSTLHSYCWPAVVPHAWL